MKMKTLAAVAGAALMGLSASPASAALFVSGDSNIFSLNVMSDRTANETFLTNIAGGLNVVLMDSGVGNLGNVAEMVAGYLTDIGYNATVLSAGSAVTTETLAGANLFVGIAPTHAFSGADTSALSGFLGTGGNVLLTGENGGFWELQDANLSINNLLAGLGSGLRIVDAEIDPDFHTANILAANSYTAGTSGFQYAATSQVTGGQALYGSAFTNTAFLSVDTGGAPGGVPEPATWALMITGFGLAGASLRRRKPVVA